VPVLWSKPFANDSIRMFSTPERRPDQSFFVPLKSPLNAGVRFEQATGGVVATLTQQDSFASLQRRVLTELCKTQSLFKHPPTLASLELITPRWGCIETEGAAQMSPYTHVDCAPMETPCFVEFALVGIQISRSTIQPFFKTVFLEKVPDSLIDLDFGGSSEEVEEVSDVGGAADTLPIVLQDPATTQRKKREAKDQIRAAFRTAEQATREAERMASEFYDAYDLSDNESAFSEWLSEASETSGSEGAEED
jgi:hypothetical protein